MHFFACFWAYIRQSHDHISWAIPMPFASINSTNPRNNPWNFHKKVLRIGWAGTWVFFLSWPFWFFFQWKQAARSYDLSFISALWLFQNLGKDFIQTNMHTTVDQISSPRKIRISPICKCKIRIYERCYKFLFNVARLPCFPQWCIWTHIWKFRVVFDYQDCLVENILKNKQAWKPKEKDEKKR